MRAAGASACPPKTTRCEARRRRQRRRASPEDDRKQGSHRSARIREGDCLVTAGTSSGSPSAAAAPLAAPGPGGHNEARRLTRRAMMRRLGLLACVLALAAFAAQAADEKQGKVEVGKPAPKF